MRPPSLLPVALAVLLAAMAPALASDDGLTELARIQTGLNRAAAGLAPMTEGTDPLERVVAAFAAGWASPAADPARAGPILAEVEAELARRQDVLAAKNQQQQRQSHDFPPVLGIEPARYMARLRAAGVASPDPLIRLIAALHAADAVLIAENVRLHIYDYAKRENQSSASRNKQADGAWLRIPCRALPGREEAFRRALAALGDLAGPVLDCPAPEGAETELAALARFAHDPAAEAGAIARRPKPNTVPAPTLAAPSPPEGAWDNETAVASMSADPERAEAVLRQADTSAGQLDYALFLFAFRPASPERDARIRALLAAVEPSTPDGGGQGIEEPGTFDGSAGSMVRHMRWASFYGKAQTMPAFYAVPCAVLLQRPDLLDALKPYFYATGDNFLPRSGCVWGHRGLAPGFPEPAVRAFADATAEPTGFFLETLERSMVYGFYTARAASIEALRVDPRGLLTVAPQPSPPPPYLVWSYLSLDNRRVQAAAQAVFTRAMDAVAAYFGSKGLDAAEARRAADTGLRQLALGQDCGGSDAPPPSFRTLLLDGAPLDEVEAFAAGEAWRDPAATAALRTCAESAGLDPLAHAATARPDALPFLLDLATREPDAVARDDLDLALGVEARNAFGKTPLMAAAQADQPDSVRLLLAHGADPNARTDAVSTAWARRTPLMYAATGGSLGAIRLLLDAGADPQAADSKGLKALHYLS